MKTSWAGAKEYIVKIIKLLFTMAALGYLIKIARPEEMIAYLTEIDISLLVIITLLKFISDIFKIWKWMLIARVQIPDFSFLAALKSFYIGMTLAVITPFAVGELGRGAFASKVRRAELSGLVIVDKVFDLATVMLFALIGLSLLFQQPFFILGIVIAYFLGLFLMKHVVVFLGKGDFLERFRLRFLKRVVSGYSMISTSLLYKLSLLTINYFVLFYFQAYLIMLAYGESFPAEVVLYFPVITLSTILPITIGGLGVREGTAIYFLKRYQIPEAVAFNTFFTHFVIANVLAGLLGAIIFLVSRGDRE